MSRTTRRKKGYVPDYVKHAHWPIAPHKCLGYKKEFRFLGNVGRKIACIDDEWYCYGTPKALGQQNAYWFGDHGYAWRRWGGKDVSKFARVETQTKHRQQAREELIKFCKNPEYEVMIPKKNLLPWD